MSHVNRRKMNVKKKNRRKVIRTIFQWMVLVAVVWGIVRALLTIHTYEEPDRTAWQQRDGFVALSFFGVQRSGTNLYIDDDRLEEHLQTLKDNGFETISQQDVIDFYVKGRPLPEKALFLSIDDGRNDSALYAQPILEKLNYRATMMTYAEKIVHHERKFLRPKHLLDMVDTGYWEIGSKGNQLTYINVLTRDGDFYSKLQTTQFDKLANVAYYNHYLMDFLRDVHMIPTENREEMFARIDKDYDALEKQYIRSLGFVPRTYMIMHANALYGGGIHRLVEEANTRNIYRLFDLHFNREGDSYNEASAHPYDLTRLQVPPYWYTNHLLMKIQQDSGIPMTFHVGDRERAKRWTVVSGAAQFGDEGIVLTSPPDRWGIAILKGTEQLANLLLEVELTGNVVGEHGLILRYDQETDSWVRISVRDNRLVIVEREPGKLPMELFNEPLSELSVPEALAAHHEARIYRGQYPVDLSPAEAEERKESYPVDLAQNRTLVVRLQDDHLSVTVDGEMMAEDIPVYVERGAVALTSRYSERNGKDTIFDGVFEGLTIENLDHDEEFFAGDGDGRIIYRDQLDGFARIKRRVESWIDSVIDWAIDTF